MSSLDERSDIAFYYRHLEREASPHDLQQQAQLPSFREIIPVHLQPSSEAQYPWPQSFDAPSNGLTPSAHSVSATPRSIVTSPTHSQGSSMPSLTGEFDDMNVRSSDAMFTNQAHTMGNMDRSTTWIPAPQYQTMPTTYAQPTQRVPQMNPQAVSSRTSPNLPPIRDINQRTNSYDPTYGTSTGHMSHVSMSSYPTQMYATSQPTTSDMDTTGFSRSMSYNDGQQYARYTATYPQTTRPYQTADYRFTTAPYDAYRYNSSPYARASYGDMNYPHAIVSSQSAAFGTQADMSGGHNRRRRGNLPKPVTDILRSWFHDHLDHPYPSEEDKQIFIQKTGLTISQISNWFINARRRHWPALRQNRDQARNSTLRRSNSGGGSI